MNVPERKEVIELTDEQKAKLVKDLEPFLRIILAESEKLIDAMKKFMESVNDLCKELPD